MLRTVESDVFLADSQRCKLTLSVGVSVFSPGQTVDDCIKAADKALYQAKRQGRNRVVVAREPVRQASGGEGIGGFDASLPLAECDRSQVR
jgi:predicted signal transduction protein with EAL and GGDEF domain